MTCPLLPKLQQSNSHNHRHGADHEAGGSEGGKTAQDREKDKKRMQFELFADQDRTQQVVNGMDDQNTSSDKNQSTNPSALQSEYDRCGYPDHRRS